MADRAGASLSAMSYVCKCCGEVHDGLPDVGFDQPAYAADVPEDERAERVRLDEDLCVVDNEHHFIRGVLRLPVHGQDEPFGIGVWVSQKAENFWTYVEHFDSSEIGPFFGWLSNDFVFGDMSALNLKTNAHFQGGTARPSIELEPTDHPLSVAQRGGISLDEAWTFVHGSGSAESV